MNATAGETAENSGHCPGAEGLCTLAGPTSLTRREESLFRQTKPQYYRCRPNEYFLQGDAANLRSIVSQMGQLR
jgi:hypothetical protein